MNEKVAIVGVLDVPGSTNIPMASAFLKYGYDIIPINYRTIIRNYGPLYFKNYMYHVTTTYKPNLILFSKCNGIDTEIVEECSKHTNTWLWNMDPINTIEKCPEVLEHAKNTTYCSCTSKTVSEWFEKNGVNKSYTIFEGFDYEIMGPVVEDNQYKADISFIGSRTQLRDEYINFLKENNINIRIYGNGYSEKPVIGKEFSKICSSSKFMLSIDSYQIPHYSSDRLILYGGCGSCMLHYYPFDEFYGDLFSGEEFLCFKDKESLLNLINNITDDQRKFLSINAREKVLKNYTWLHLVSKIINTYKEES